MSSELRTAWVARLDEQLRMGRASLRTGRVCAVVGGLVEARVPEVVVGHVCEIVVEAGSIRAEVVGFDGETARLQPWGSAEGIGVGAKVVVGRRPGGRLRLDQVCGRVLDGLGEPLDGGPELSREIGGVPPVFVRRTMGLADRLETGVGGVDVFAPVGRGARVAVIGEAGSGKTHLLRRMREGLSGEAVVIGLVGERAREAASLIEEVMSGPHRGQTTVVVATSEAPASERVAAALLAADLAERIRGEGGDCLLLLDSVSRYARALRELAQVRGEPMTPSGYPVTMPGALAALLERAGVGQGGSVTGIYTVLASSEREQGPVAEEVRSLVDVQVVLRRQLADRGQYPAVDLVASMSRLSEQLLSPEALEVARVCRGALGLIEQHRDALELGYYRTGSRPALDAAVAAEEEIRGALLAASGAEVWRRLEQVAVRLRQ